MHGRGGNSSAVIVVETALQELLLAAVPKAGCSEALHSVIRFALRRMTRRGTGQQSWKLSLTVKGGSSQMSE